MEEENKIEEAKSIIAKEGENLCSWMQGNINILNDERSLILQCHLGFIDDLTIGQAKKVVTIYHKAVNLGYPERNPSHYQDKLTAIEKYIEKQVENYFEKQQRNNPKITREEARMEYAKLYKDSYGISFDDPCPKCKARLGLRKHSRYNYIGLGHYICCSNYPNDCDFFANSKNKV